MRREEICRIEWHDVDMMKRTVRLFEAGLSIERVALFTGHKDWRMLRRHTNLKPEGLHNLQKRAQPSIEEHVEALISQ